MLLLDIPIDLLAQITRRVPAHTITALYLIGPALSFKLFNGGVQEMVAHYPLVEYYFPFPAFIEAMKGLRVLDVDSTYPVDLRCLPSSLTSITICSDQIEDIFSAKFLEDDDAPEPTEDGIRWTDLASLFPSLLTLRVHATGHHDLDNAFIDSLPASLTYLEVRKPSWISPKANFARFPSLVSLHIEFGVDWSDSADPCTLPPTLRSFSLGDLIKLQEGLGESKEGFCLPSFPDLDTLELYPQFWSKEALSKLPRSLTKFKAMPIGTSPFDISEKLQRNVELTLTHLPGELRAITVIRGLIPTAVTLLPRNLTSLKLRSIVFNLDLWNNLPQLLVKLEIHQVSDTRTEFPSKPLPNLSWLHISFSQSLPDPNVFFAHFPKSLDHLTIDFRTKDEIRLTPAEIELLPRNLSTLKMLGNGMISLRAVKAFPSRLTSLTIDLITSVHDEFIRFLPPNLLVLRVAHDIEIHDTTVELLPLYLHTLELPCNPNISAYGLSRLPKNLTRLSLSSALEDSSVAYLPRGLLSLSLERDGLTDMCLADLPFYLEQISCASESVNVAVNQAWAHRTLSPQYYPPARFPGWEESFNEKTMELDD